MTRRPGAGFGPITGGVALAAALLLGACKGGESPTGPGGDASAVIASISVSPPSYTMVSGGSVQLAATSMDAGGQMVTGRTVTWASSNTAVATVSSGGLVAGVAPGSATITASVTGSSVTGSSPVTVGSPAFVSVSAGVHYSCGLTATGEAYCWGVNDQGQLGDGTTPKNPILLPVGVAGGLRFAVVDAAMSHTCALAANGAAYCWGENYAGQIGDGTTTNRLRPTLVSGDLTFTMLQAAGGGVTCGLTAAGTAYCWGNNSEGELGRGTSGEVNGPAYAYAATPAPVTGGQVFRDISGTLTHFCGVTTSGAGYCWGSNLFEQLAVGGYLPDGVPEPAPTHAYRALSAGWFFTCGILTDSSAVCWGDNSFGQFGDGADHEGGLLEHTMSGGLRLTGISGGFGHNCGLTADGRAYCWGLNSNGQLGNGKTGTNALLPEPVATDLRFTVISAGYHHTCGATTTGLAYCWGDNDNGQLGDGSTTESGVPVKVAGQP